MTRRHAYWICQVVGWSFYGLLGYIVNSVWPPPQGWHFSVHITGPVVAMIVTHILRAVIRGLGWLSLPPAELVPRMIGSTVVCALIISLSIGLAMSLGFRLFPLADHRWLPYLAGAVIWLVPVAVWQLIYYSTHYFERMRHAELDRVRLDAAAKDAQLRMLLSQLNPHFLFNSLNSLRALIVEDPARAQTMVTELAGILRYSLHAGRADTVPLYAEIEAVASYLKLEAIRLEERLRVQLNIDPEVHDALLPPMLLQTLVENGVKYGICRVRNGGEIRVAARRAGDDLLIEVSNTGQLSVVSTGTRIGLDNARQRLAMMFGSAASLLLFNRDPGTVVAELKIPYARAAD